MELKQADHKKRISKEERVYDLLDQLNIDYQRIDHESRYDGNMFRNRKLYKQRYVRIYF